MLSNQPCAAALVLLLAIQLQGQETGPTETDWGQQRISIFLQSFTIETKQFPPDLSFMDSLKIIDAAVNEKAVGFKLVLDLASFQDAGFDAKEIKSTPVRVSRSAGRFSLQGLLKMVIVQLPDDKATYKISKGTVTICSAARPSRRPGEVQGFFANEPLELAAKRLSEMTGQSIIIDRRILGKAKTKVAADFVGSTSIEAVLFVLADMSGLDFVQIDDTVYYITSVANARAIQQRQSKKRD